MIDENLAIWALWAIRGLGFARMRILISQYGKASSVFEQTFESLRAMESVEEPIARQIVKTRDWQALQTAFQDSIPEKSDFIPITDPGYPDKLRNIPDPPPYFYCRGNLEVLKKPCLAVVGSRRPSDYGVRITRNIVRELAAAGVTIVSGLAVGIDSISHETAIQSGGCTVAVFGNSLEIIYPAGNRRLAEEIGKRGCLISEFPKGTKPAPYNFPVRNRIISGLSEGVLVVEAQEQSGALITANHALDQGREVLAVPGNIDNKLSAGPNNLLKHGAVPVSSAQDIFDYFRWYRSSQKERPTIGSTHLTGEEKKIIENLSVKPIHLDDLMRKTGLGPGKTAEVLLNLELKGFIIRKPGNYLVLA